MTNLRKLSVFLFVMATLLVSLSVQAANPTPRIVGGSIVTDNRYQFMAALYFDPDGDGTFNFGCGGSFITSTWVLTAAHCFVDSESGDQRPASTVVIRAGALDILDLDQGNFVRASNIIVHPGYDPVTSVSDIALIELSEAVSQTVIALPAVGSNVPIVDESSVVAGWGTTSEGGALSKDLQQVVVPVVSHADCLGNYPNALISDANVCAGGAPSGGLDSCQGDSGGPLFVVRDNVFVQAGIVSYGNGCARADIPGVYTRMTSYTNWVASLVPNVLINNTGVGVFNPADNIGVPQLTLLNAAAPVQTGTLQEGNYIAYDIGNASRVELTSQTGDADLYIFNKARLESNQAVCSVATVTSNEACDIPASNEGQIAIVYAYEQVNYRISLPNAATDPQEDDPSINTTTTLLSSSSGGGSIGVSLIALLASLVMLRRREQRVV